MFDPTDNESLLSIKVQQLSDKDAASPHFKILRLTGTEAISALFEFELFMVIMVL